MWIACLKILTINGSKSRLMSQPRGWLIDMPTGHNKAQLNSTQDMSDLDYILKGFCRMNVTQHKFQRFSVKYPRFLILIIIFFLVKSNFDLGLILVKMDIPTYRFPSVFSHPFIISIASKNRYLSLTLLLDPMWAAFL